MSPRTKPNYHHGDLRQTLVDAATQLVTERGPNQFSMADACRIAGVSKAAPYRHFANKNELLKVVVQDGFLGMRDAMEIILPQYAPGSNNRIAAIGMAYIEFALANPAVFKLMFGNSTSLEYEHDDDLEGRGTFQILLNEVTIRSELSDSKQLMHLAFPLWTLVHGAALLTIDNAYERIYPDSNIDEMIYKTTELMLRDFPEPKE